MKSCIALFIMITLSACPRDLRPEKIVYGRDICDYCKMTLSDHRFGGEIVSPKGKISRFDSLQCLHSFKSKHQHDIGKIFLVDSMHPGSWISPEEAHFAIEEQISSPMGRAIFAAKDEKDLSDLPSFKKKETGRLKGVLTWNQLEEFFTTESSLR